MAIKQNPDWYVWVGDVLYWVVRPPQIYFIVMGCMALALIWNYTPQQYRPFQVAVPAQQAQPQYIPQQQPSQPVSQPQYSQPSIQPCPAGTKRVGTSQCVDRYTKEEAINLASACAARRGTWNGDECVMNSECASKGGVILQGICGLPAGLHDTDGTVYPYGICPPSMAFSKLTNGCVSRLPQ